MTSRAKPLEEAILTPRVSRLLALWFFGTILLLAAGHFIVFFIMKSPPWSLRFQLNLDGEGNLTAWVNGCMLLAASLAAFLVWWLCKARSHDSVQRKADRLGWLLAGVLFFYLATDEVSQIHDVLAGVLEYRIGRLLPSLPKEILWYAWIPLFVGLGVAAVVVMAALLRRTLLRNRPASLYALGGVICFMLNPVVEILENRRVDLLPVHLRGEGPTALMVFNPEAWHELQALIILEEGLEMIGATCFLLAFLRYGRHLLDQRGDSIRPA